MTEATYRTGQAAKLLDTSSHHIRRLCEAGLIEADLTQGNRWRIPAAEVERLKRDGVPPIPQPSPEYEPIAPAGGTRPPAIARPAVESPATESDAVREEQDGLRIAETQLKRRRVELEMEEVEDSFRDRELRGAQAAAAERRRQEEQQAANRRRSWEQSWLQVALAAIPDDAPPESRLEVIRQAEAALKGIDWQHAPEITRRVIEAVVSQALQPYFQARRRAEAIARTLTPIPAAATAYRAKAKRAAEAALAKLPPNAPPDDLREAAEVAVAPIVSELQHEAAKAEILETMRLWGWLDATPDEQQQAREAVAEALDAVPVGSPRSALATAKANALAPIEQGIHQRKETKQRKATAAQVADSALWHVDSYLRENVEFDSFTERVEEERRLKDELRPVLIREILDGLPPDEVPEFIEEWLDEELAFDEDDDDEDDD